MAPDGGGEHGQRTVRRLLPPFARRAPMRRCCRAATLVQVSDGRALTRLSIWRPRYWATLLGVRCGCRG